MYAIAEFPGPKQKEIAIVHRTWISGNNCYWPPFWRNNSLLKTALKKGQLPDPNTWLLFPARIVGNKFFDTYEAANAKLSIAVEGSELSADEISGKRKRSSSRRNNSEADSSDSDSPTPTHLFKKPKSRRCLEKSFTTLPEPPTAPTDLFSAPSHTLVAVADLTNSPVSMTSEPQDLNGSQKNQAAVVIASPGNPTTIPGQTQVSTSNNDFLLSLDAFEPGTSRTSSAPGFLHSTTSSCFDITARNELREIRNNQVLIMAKLDLILDGVSTILATRKTEMSHTPVSNQLNLPLSSMDELTQLEANIKQTASLKENLIGILSCSGGNNVNQISHRVLSSLMTDEVMTKFTFAGKTGRTSFRETVFMPIVCAAVKQQPKGSVGNNHEIEKATEYWLKKAPTRIAAKNKKQAAHSEQLTTTNEED